MIDLRSLEVFYWTVRLGGFGRAAAKLNTTQPAVSSRIAQLEDTFGARLLERDRNRPVAATAKGLALVAYAERALGLHAEMLAAMFDASTLRGTVRLGVAETLVHTWLGALVRRLHEALPQVTPDVTVDVSVRLREALLAGEIDVALMVGPVGRADIRCLDLCVYDMVWAAAPSVARPFAEAGTIALARLATLPIITYARPTQPYQALVQLFAHPDLPRPRLFANSSLAAMVRMARDGIGVAVVPAAAIAPELARGELVRIAAEAHPPPIAFVACLLAAADPAGIANAVARLALEVAAG